MVIQLARRLRRPGVPTLTLLLLVSLVGLGCGSGGDPPATPRPAPTPQAAAPPSDGAIAIADFKYVPEDVTVEVGTTVTWTNEDAAPHTATADDGSFDTGDLRKSDSGEVTFRKAGSFAYFCEFHKFMRANVTVR